MIKGFGKYTTFAKQNGERTFVTRSNFITSASTAPGGNFTMTAQTTAKNTQQGILEGYVNLTREEELRAMYWDMYDYDNIAGQAIDTYSVMPFSDFSIGSMTDPKRLEKYVECAEKLKLKTLFPGIAIDYLTVGAFLGILSFDDEKKYFVDVIPQNLDNVELTATPFFGMDPLVDVSIDPDLQKILENKDNDERINILRNRLPEWLKKGLAKGGKGKNLVQIDPSNVLYIPRRGRTTGKSGVSILRRLLPIYIMEKAIIRGTIEHAYRRRGSILHVTVGDDEWDATDNDMESVAGLFQRADMDPDNAIVITPQGVMANEIRSGGDFWRYTDGMYDFSATAKLRALGINDAFLSGDASYSSLEASLTVFVEQIRSFRDTVTREVFYDKIFPAVAIENDFKKSRNRVYGAETEADVQKATHYAHVGTKIIRNSKGHYIGLCAGDVSNSFNDADINDYEIPSVEWHKQLKPEGDQAYLEILNNLDAKIPVPLRVFAAAAGVNIDQIIASQDEDIETREKAADYQKRIKDIYSEQGLNPDQGEEDAFNQFSSTRRPNKMFQREWDDDGAPVPLDKNGKRRFTTDKHLKERSESINKMIATVASENAKKENAKALEQEKLARKRDYYIMPESIPTEE